MLKERMTPEEIAHLTGFSRQTINKWVRKEGWQTSPRPGVQGGKARLVHVNEQVRIYPQRTARGGTLPSIPRQKTILNPAADAGKEMTPGSRSS
jgi:predicted DNA-binding transcriptional regulator AlpA